MRRVVLAVPVLVTVVGGFATAAWAQAPGASATPVAAKAVPGKAVCAVSDERLTELSGMVATSSGYVVANDSTDRASHRKIFFLGTKCDVKRSVPYTSRDPEDVAQDKAGTIWVADIGDNPDSAQRRSTIALWKLPKGADEPTIYRMTYPDGPHDAEALLLAGDGTPVVVTKDPGSAGVYVPAAPLAKGQAVALKKAGEVRVPKTTTPNPLGVAGRLVVTGGANSPDGKRVVLRTYADAFEFDVTNGNVVEAITKGTPRITPLPQEPRGESITYTPDGKSFLTVSEGDGPKILRYAPAAPAKSQPKKVGGSAGKPDDRSWFDDLTFSDITYLIGGVGVLGLILVTAGVIGIILARRRPPEADQDGAGVGVATALPSGPSPESGPLPETARATPVSPIPAGQGHERSAWDRQPPAGTEYGRGSARRGSGGEYRSSRAAQASVDDDRAYRPSGATGRGGVYGTPTQRTKPPSGTVYGGRSGGGSQDGGSGGGPQNGSSSQYEPPFDYADQEPRF